MPARFVALGDGFEGVVLTDDAGGHQVFQMEHGVDFVLLHFANRNAGPGGDDFADDLRVHADAHERRIALESVKLGVEFSELGAKGGGIRRRLSGSARGSGHGCVCGGRSRSRFKLRADISDSGNQGQLLTAAFFKGFETCSDLCFLLGDLGEAFGMIDADGRFAFEDPLLDVEVVHFAHGVFDHRRSGVLTERKAGTSGIHDADSFVWELAACEIAVREFRCRANRFIENANVVVFLERTDDAAEHDHTLFFGGLFDFDNLETASKRGVFFKELFVFRPGGGGDGAEFSTGQGGLEQIGGIALPCRAAGADHGVGFVDEENDGGRGRLHLFDQPFESIFEFAFNTGAGLQERKVERADGDVFEHWRHVTRSDPQGKALNDSGFADTRFTGQDRIVLAAARENVDDLADFVIAAENSVNFSCFRVGGEIDCELIQILLFASGWNARRALGQTFDAERNSLGGFLVFWRTGNDVPEVFVKGFGTDFLKFTCDLAHEARKIAGAGNRQNAEAGADLSGAKVDGANGPSFRKHVRERGAEGGSAGVSGF